MPFNRNSQFILKHPAARNAIKLRQDKTGDLIVDNGPTADAFTMVRKISATVARSAFTDGGGTSGTYDLTTQIPAGATVIRSAVTAITGFTGNTSATMTIGDGSDVDRYNTSTINVFATAANGADAGEPSGVKYHTAAATVRLTITGGSDFTAISAGSVTVEIYYLT